MKSNNNPVEDMGDIPKILTIIGIGIGMALVISITAFIISL